MGWFGWLLLGVFWLLVIIGIGYLFRALTTRKRVALGEDGTPIDKSNRLDPE